MVGCIKDRPPSKDEIQEKEDKDIADMAMGIWLSDNQVLGEDLPSSEIERAREGVFAGIKAFRRYTE